MVLVSSKLIAANEVLTAYYLRQSVEQVFGFSKSELGLLPIRHHTEHTIKDYLFLQFLLLILFIQLREKISKTCTVEQALMALRKLKCKVFDDKIVPLEPTRKQKDILDIFQILVPKKLGI